MKVIIFVEVKNNKRKWWQKLLGLNKTKYITDLKDCDFDVKDSSGNKIEFESDEVIKGIYEINTKQELTTGIIGFI